MSKSRPPYLAEFRQQMVELVRAGRNPAGLAREFGCNPIGNWVAQAGVDAGKPPRGKEGALTSAEREELAPCGVRCDKCRWSATSWQRLRPGSLAGTRPL